MIIEDCLGTAALRGFADGIYFVTQDAAWPVSRIPDLRRRLEATCARFFSAVDGSGQSGVFVDSEGVAREGLFASTNGAVCFGFGRAVFRVDESPELMLQLVKVCRRALETSHPADPWELD